MSDSHQSHRQSQQPDISVIIVTHNSVGALEHSLPTLLVATAHAEPHVTCEVMIYDNNSADHSISCAERIMPDVIVLRNSENLGFGMACTRAAHRARGKYLLFLNPDVILDSTAILELHTAAKAHPVSGAIVARMRNPDGSFQPTCRQLPTPKNIFQSRGAVGGKNRAGYTLPDNDTITEVPAASATCMLTSREVFLSVGGFDQRFFMFMEDTDYCASLGEIGRKIYFVPSAGGVHLWGGGSNSGEARRALMHHLSVLKYFQKRIGGIFSFLVLPIALVINYGLRALTGFKRHQ